MKLIRVIALTLLCTTGIQNIAAANTEVPQTQEPTEQKTSAVKPALLVGACIGVARFLYGKYKLRSLQNEIEYIIDSGRHISRQTYNLMVAYKRENHTYSLIAALGAVGLTYLGIKAYQKYQAHREKSQQEQATAN